MVRRDVRQRGGAGVLNVGLGLSHYTADVPIYAGTVLEKMLRCSWCSWNSLQCDLGRPPREASIGGISNIKNLQVPRPSAFSERDS